MTEIFPFRGYRYNPEKVGHVADVVTQPYDKITPEMKEGYLKRHPHNIVRVIKNPDYDDAAGHLAHWMSEGILIQDASPAFYPYEQGFELEGQTHTRLGFIGLITLREAGLEVKGHEKVLKEPLEDRLNLIRATQANEGLVFTLFSDPQMQVERLLRQFKAGRQPIIQVVDEDGVTHKVWRLSDERAMDHLKAAMKSKSLYIADGHHRFQTSLVYYRECLEKGYKPAALESFDKRMMAFFNLSSPALRILPTHRALHNLPGFKLNDFLGRLEPVFEIQRRSSVAELTAELNGEGHRLGLAGRQPDELFLLRLKPGLVEDTSFMPDVTGPLRELDVNVLHEGILRPFLGLGPEELAGQKFVDYYRNRDEMIHRLRVSQYQLAFLLRPTSLEQVQRVAERGEKMPQKSTDFYPKLLTGLVIMKMRMETL